MVVKKVHALSGWYQCTLCRKRSLYYKGLYYVNWTYTTWVFLMYKVPYTVWVFSMYQASYIYGSILPPILHKMVPIYYMGLMYYYLWVFFRYEVPYTKCFCFFYVPSLLHIYGSILCIPPPIPHKMVPIYVYCHMYYYGSVVRIPIMLRSIL